MPTRSRGKSDDGVLSGLPTYAKIAAWVGFPGVAAGYLIYVLTSSQAQRIQHIEDALRDHEKTSAAVLVQLKAQTDQTWVQIAVINRICLNTAKTDADKMACVTVARSPQ